VSQRLRGSFAARSRERLRSRLHNPVVPAGQASRPSDDARRAAHTLKKTHGPSPAAAEIPDKLYFRIGEVARLCGVQTYVLRFWETEFPQLKPGKSGTGQRLYRKREVELALRIRRLLYDEGHTIPGARLVFQQEARGRLRIAQPPVGAAPAQVTDVGGGSTANNPQLQLDGVTGTPPLLKVHRLKAELREILGMLSTPPGRPRLVRKENRKSPPELFAD